MGRETRGNKEGGNPSRGNNKGRDLKAATNVMHFKEKRPVLSTRWKVERSERNVRYSKNLKLYSKYSGEL